jgi:hypothetical protein
MEANLTALGNNRSKTNFRRNIKNCNKNTNKLILDDVPYEDVSGLQYRSSVTNNNDITVEIKEITASVTLACEIR